MKVSIVTEGSHTIGYGHITRCLSLYQAFEARNIIPSFYINGDSTFKNLLKDVNYEIINWVEEKELFFNKINDSDVVIVDSYLANKNFYEKISLSTPLPLFIDDYKRLDYPSGIILNGSINGKELDYSTKNDQTLLLGTKYTPLRKEFWDIPDKQTRLSIHSILITFGGQDVHNLTPRILKVIVRNYPDIKKKVVIGGGFQNVDQIIKAKDKLTEIYTTPSATEMLNLMLECDVAISAAGQTIYELAQVGIPTIAIAVADNQKNNLAGWVKEKFIDSELTYLQPNLENRLLLRLANLKRKQIREELSRIGKQKVDGTGAKRIVQFLIDKYSGKHGFYLRNATHKDSAIIFNLSNDRLVRTNSINQNPINWFEHLDWLSGKLLDDDCIFLLAFTNNDNFIGQVRFDVTGSFASINISIDKEYRGKGFAKNIIFQSSYKYFHEKPNVNSILAYIHPLNIPSIKAFSRSGYIFSHKEKINEEEFLVYKLTRQDGNNYQRK